MELNIRLTVLVVETARLERRGVNDTYGQLIAKQTPVYSKTIPTNKGIIMNPPIQQVIKEVQNATYVTYHYTQNNTRKGEI